MHFLSESPNCPYRILDCKLEQSLNVWAVLVMDETKPSDVFWEQRLLSNF